MTLLPHIYEGSCTEARYALLSSCSVSKKVTTIAIQSVSTDEREAER